jgi:hypothetical protein
MGRFDPGGGIRMTSHPISAASEPKSSADGRTLAQPVSRNRTVTLSEEKPVRSKRLRLFFLIRALDAGGAQRQLTELVKRLDKTRFEVVVATFLTAASCARKSSLFQLGSCAALAYSSVKYASRRCCWTRKNRKHLRSLH